MQSPSPVEIIDNAIFCNTAFALAYTDPDQKWLIRQHLLSLHREFLLLRPTVSTFIHDDGDTVNLLKAEGYLNISPSLPPVHVNIWIHEHYPHTAPMVQVTSNPSNPIRSNHPFVNPAGITSSSYLHTWVPFGYDLLGLAYNLVKLFSLDHPFCFVNAPNLSHSSYTSKMDCMDRLWWMLHYDMVTLRENTNEEIEKLTALQDEMRTRVDVTTSMIVGMDVERSNLKERVKEMTDEADMLINWLSVNISVAMGTGEVEDAFECVDEESKMVMEWLAEEKGLEDVMDAVYKALEKRVINFEAYIKQVRSLARDQFFIRAKLMKLKGPQIFNFLD